MSTAMPPLTAEEFAADFPADELVVYRNEVLGVECLIAIPRAKIAAVVAAGGQPPFWRHGEVIQVERFDGPHRILSTAEASA